jgi:predicted nucleic acid-binding protein
MKTALDSSILVSALYANDDYHIACHKLLLSGRISVFAHTFTETFSTLTGGRLGFRVPASDAATILREQIAPKLMAAYLDVDDLFQAYNEAEDRGIRGGAIHDYLHLFSARKSGAKRFYTLNLTDFLAFHRPGDPEIVTP